MWIFTGQELWVKRLKWEGLPSFNKLRWTALDDPTSIGVTGAFYKTYRNFAFYWILKAGHMVRHWLQSRIRVATTPLQVFFLPNQCLQGHNRKLQNIGEPVRTIQEWEAAILILPAPLQIDSDPYFREKGEVVRGFLLKQMIFFNFKHIFVTQSCSML